MSSITSFSVWLLLLLSWPLESNAYRKVEKFNPKKIIPVKNHFPPYCGSGSAPAPHVPDDYYIDYDYGGTEAETPICQKEPNLPTIWILEFGTRFMNSLENGHKSSKSKGLLDIRANTHTGVCYRFVSLEDNLNVEEMTDLIIGLVKEDQIRTILLIVEHDQLETKSTSLKHQIVIIQYLLGQRTFDNLFLIVGHPYGKDDNSAKRDAVKQFSNMFQWPPETIELFIMSNSDNLYVNIFKDENIKNAINGPSISIENGNLPPILLSDNSTKIEQTTFSVSSFFSASEVETWKLEWLVGVNLLWRVEGHAEGVIAADKTNDVEGVIETNQTVTYITKNLYAAKVWIKPKVQQIMTIEIDVSAKLSKAHFSVSAWEEWEAWSRCNMSLIKTRKRQTENGNVQLEEENCDITSLTDPTFCNKIEFPQPRILFIGATGVGKSTLGNKLLGVSKGRCLEKGRCIECKKDSCKPGQCEKEMSKGVCEKCKVGQCKKKRGSCNDFECVKRKNYRLGKPMNETENLPFEPGSGIDSKTLKINTYRGQFLGNGPCVTLIDTPGAADTKGRDYEHAIKMATFLKNDMGSFDAILLMLNGEEPRFSSHTIALLKLYQEIFGKEMWQNVIIEMSFWQHTETAACNREKNLSINEVKKTEQINEKLKQVFHVNHTVPIVFVDPVFGGFDPNLKVEPRELDIFQNQTINLWKSMKEMTEYKCSENCQAPADFFKGTPLLESANKVEDGQKNFVVSCKIWNGMISGDSSHKNSDSMKWFFDGDEMFSQGFGEDPMVKTEIMETYGFEIVPPTLGHGSQAIVISTLTIDRVNGKQHRGNFRCMNKKGEAIWKLIIPFWSEWGAWSQCTKSCMTYDPPEPLGTKKRTRRCEGDQNKVDTCSKSEWGELQVKDCKTVYCPVAPVLTDWTTWTSCSPACGKGKRSRERRCTEGKFHSEKKDDKCPTKNHETYEIQPEVCEIGPCPKACVFGDWAEWTSCKPACAKNTNVTGKKKRYRSVTESAIGGGTCGANETVESCQLPDCPVDGSWGEWHDKTCISSIGCGKGIQERWRRCKGRKGTGKLCMTFSGSDEYETGFESENVECLSGQSCAVDCVLGEWSIPRCQAPCGSYKVVTKSRPINTRPKHDGKKCGNTREDLKCFGDPCPAQGGCYSRNSLVSLSNGNSVKMSSLKIGDNVEISDENGNHGYSEFVGWMEKDKTQKVSFYKLTTESGNELVMTGSHGLFVEKDGIVSATFTNSLEIGNSLILSNQSNGTKTERLVFISMVSEMGWLDPLTKSGTIMVNNISTSCYASFPHWLANLALFPARHWPNIFLDDVETEGKDGTREYIHFIKRFGRLFSGSGFRIDDKYSKASSFMDFERSFSFPALRTGDDNLQDTGLTIVWLSMMAGLFGIFFQRMYKK